MALRDRQRLRRLLPYLGRDRRRLVLTLVLLLPVALAAAVQPLLVGQAIAVLRREPTMPWLEGMAVPQALQLLVLVLLGAVLLRLALQGIQTFNVQAVGQRLTARIRDDLFAHAMALSLRFHDRTPVGKLLTRLTSDVDALAEVFGSGAVGVLGDLVTLIVIAATMLTIEWRLGLLLLIAQVPVTLGILWLQGRYRKANYRVREELSQLNADLQENLQGLEVVQMFRRERRNSERFAVTTGAYRRAVTGTILYDSAISAFIEWIALVAVALVLALGGSMVTAGVMGLGTLTTFILYSQRLFDPLRQLAERFTQIQGGLTAVERIGNCWKNRSRSAIGRSHSLWCRCPARPLRWCLSRSALRIAQTSRFCRTSRCALHRENTWHWWDPPARARQRSSACSAASMSRNRGGSCWMASTFATCLWPACGSDSVWCCRTRFCSAAPLPTICASTLRSAANSWSEPARSLGSIPCSIASAMVWPPSCGSGAATCPQARSSCWQWPGWRCATPRCW